MIMPARRSALINVMVKAAFRAARGLQRDFGEVEQLQVSQKGPGDFVSQADLNAEQAIREDLAKARPEFGFVLEEGGEIAGAGEHAWLVDPLDGTTNFLHGLPHWAISIAVRKGPADKGGDVIAGVVYDPLRDELFWAERGIGAYVADRRAVDRRLRVSARRKLSEAVLATGIRPADAHDDDPRALFLRQVDEATTSTAGIRRWGSAALDLAYVAAGRFDAFWENKLAPWDIGAGIVLVREAGGMVTDLDGGQTMLSQGSLLAATEKLHQPMRRMLRHAAAKP